MPAMPNYSSVQEYLAAQTPEAREALLQLREAILLAAPNVNEQITYKNPGYQLTPDCKRNEHIRIAAYKEHVSFYPSTEALEEFAKELEQYEVGRGTVQFSLRKDVPKKLIAKMVRWQLKEILAKDF